MKYFLSSLDHNDPKIVDFTMFQTKDMYDICMANFYHEEPLYEASKDELPDVRIYFIDNTLFEAVRNPSHITFGVSVLIDHKHKAFVCLDKACEEVKKNEFFKTDLKLAFNKLGELSDDELCAIYTAKWLSDGLFTYLHGDNV